MSKKRLRPWLEAKLNAGNIPGLRWLNDEKTLFRITWKHGGKQQWTEEDAQIFKEWAIHTGRYSEGIDSPDHATWKTRLRCAMNKSDDINERKDLSRTSIDEAFKVFEFKRDAPSEPKPSIAYSPASSVASPRPAVEITHQPLELIGEPYNTTFLKQEPREASLDSDLKDIPLDDLMGVGSSSLPKTSFTDDKGQFDNILDVKPSNIAQPPASSVNEDFEGYEGQVPTVDITTLKGYIMGSNDQQNYLPNDMMAVDGMPIDIGSPVEGVQQQPTTLWSPIPQPVECHDDFAQPTSTMSLGTIQQIQQFTSTLSVTDQNVLQSVDTCIQMTLTYSGATVVTNYYSLPIHVYTAGKVIDKQKLKLEGKALQEVLLTDPADVVPQCQKLINTKEALKRMNNGLILECQNGDIYVTRWSGTKLFVSSQYCEFKELKRNIRTKVFDINDFLLALKKWNNGPKPSAEIYISVGSEWRLQQNSIIDAFILMCVCSIKARTYLQLFDDHTKKGALYSINSMTDTFEKFSSDLENSLPAN